MLLWKWLVGVLDTGFSIEKSKEIILLEDPVIMRFWFVVARRFEVSGVRRVGEVKSLVGFGEARMSHILMNRSSELVKKMCGSLELGWWGERRGAIELIEVLCPTRVRYSTDWIGNSGLTPFAAFFLAR